MNKGRIYALAALLASACSLAPRTPPPQRRPPGPAPRAEAAAPAPAPNPLLEAWSGPYGGVPPFDRVQVAHFKPALEAAMALARRENEAIAASAEAPTFENTVAALEDAGRAFNRVYEVYSAWSSAVSSPEFQAVEREMAPKLAAFWAEATANAALFRRVEAVHHSPEASKLTAEQRRLVAYYYDDFLRSGAALDGAGGARVAAIDGRLAELYIAFSQNVLADEARGVVLESEADLSGLPEPSKRAAAAAAEAHGLKGKWEVENTRSAVADFLTYADRRDLRERVFRNYDGRGDNGGARDNNKNVAEILALRAERAKLLGHKTHAHAKLAASMVKTPERAVQLLEALWPPAVARVREDVAAMRALDRSAGRPAKIAPSDYRYYAERVRKAKYDFDENEVRAYLQLDRLRDGMFWAAGELFGLQFSPAQGVPVYHPDVSVFEAKDRASGRHVGLLYFDPYARPGKYNGGQTDTYRVREGFRGEATALVSNSTPFVKPAAGGPALLGWRDAQTLFHEFGHALHVLSSKASYPSLSGGRVVRDYGEFPSKLFEHWLSTPELLGRFALHHETGEAMPAPLLAKLKKAATFNQGFYMVDYLTSALVEMKMHLEGDRPVDPDAFERETLKRLGAPEEVGMRFRMPHFGHVFAGDGYSAGYYMYLWADVLAADAFKAFAEGKGPYDTDVAARLREHVLSAGNMVDPFEGYRAFRGRDAGLDALMLERGFSKAGASKLDARRPKLTPRRRRRGRAVFRPGATGGLRRPSPCASCAGGHVRGDG